MEVLAHLIDLVQHEEWITGPSFLQTLDQAARHGTCLLYTSDAADERSSVDLGGRRIIKKKTRITLEEIGNIK